jgi:zinc transport system ATP-binding protein
VQLRPVIELDGVSFSYGAVRTVDDVSLAVQPGDVLGIIGPNGSGKTTLLRLMLGLAVPQEGVVRLFGAPPAALRDWRRLGYVPQRTTLDASLPITVREVVGTGLVPTLGIWRRPGNPGRERVREVLELVGMDTLAGARIGALSAGQQQRVLIARALVGDPELLVLDEPTGGIDPRAQTSFYALLRHLNRERGVTLILVSHDTGVIAHEVNRLACMNRRLLFCGRPEDALSDVTLTALYGSSVRAVGHAPPCPHAPDQHP